VGKMSCPGLAFDAEPGAAADGGGTTAFPRVIAPAAPAAVELGRYNGQLV